MIDAPARPGFRVGTNAPQHTEVLWGSKQGWRIIFQQKVYGPHTSTVIFKWREPKFWEALIQAGVIVAVEDMGIMIPVAMT